MKKQFLFIAILLCSIAGYSQALTLSQKADIARSEVFQQRLYQAMFSKANTFISDTPIDNLQKQKRQIYGNLFVRGAAGGIDIKVLTHYWLAGYTKTTPVLDGNGQPTDAEITNSSQLNTVFDNLAGVVAGDASLPVNP
jgi:hypothetical protein